MAEGEESVESLVNRSITNMVKEQDETLPQTGVERLKVAYIYSYKLLNSVNKLPKVKGRALLVHMLINSYNLFKYMNVIESNPASDLDLRTFHSEDYLNYIKELDKKVSEQDADDFCLNESIISEEFGICYDCPAFPNIYETISHIAGSTLTAAKAIANAKYSTAINWFGGWHHSHQSEASGYCYVNDIVISILYLLQKGFQKILYVDLDLHHGDAVENAFSHTSKVMTVSFHKYEFGFFPGTGSVEDIGLGARGKYYSVNVPFKDGIGDEQYYFMFRQVLNKIKDIYKPEIIICQMGADTLFGDEMNGFNLTQKGVGNCLSHLLNFKLPSILLGGGGYNLMNTARLWTYLTSIAVNVTLDNDIPDHCFFQAYRPSYELQIEKGNRKDLNSDEYLQNILKTIFKNLDNIK